MIRVTGGQYRSRQIYSPKRDDEIRPTTSMVRESIFNRLQTKIAGSRFLDLFAGSGIMGIEVISRGAEFALAVEKNRHHAQLIQGNYALLEILEDQFQVITRDALNVLDKENSEKPFDIVFLDPPYGFDKTQEVINLVLEKNWVDKEGVILVEQGSNDPELQSAQRKIFGDTALSMISVS